MFLTGFSSPFISIFLAVVLPWLIILFGKETGQKIKSDARVIFHIGELSSEKEINTDENYFLFAFDKESDQKQNTAICHQDKNYIVYCVAMPALCCPANDTIFDTLVSRNTGNRAPPAMFTI